MSTTAGQAKEILLRRVRQTGGIACSEAFALSILSKCQRIINAGGQFDIQSGTLSVAKQKLVHSIKDNITGSGLTEFKFSDILYITGAGVKNIPKAASIEDFSAYDIDWWRKIDGTAIEMWMQLGRDLLITYPGLAAATTYSVYGIKYNPVLDDDSDSFQLKDERVDDVIKLSEIILLTRGRQYDEVKKRIKEFTG
jgi:hypothetical protein